MPALPAHSAPTTLAEALAQLEALRALARVPEETPNPILRFSPAGERLYANAAALALQSQLTETAHATLYAELWTAAGPALAA
ncbi:hypothetical protein, partial [Hymenobacter agri]